MDFLFNYNDILSYYNKKINEKTNFTDLQPGSELYNQIQNDTRLGCWHKEELKNIIREKGKSLIEILKSSIIQENDENNINSNNKINRIIKDNLKYYKESFYTKPWNSIIHYGIHKNRNKSFYNNIKKIDKRLFLEIVDLLLSVERNNNISFFNILHLKI